RANSPDDRSKDGFANYAVDPPGVTNLNQRGAGPIILRRRQPMHTVIIAFPATDTHDLFAQAGNLVVIKKSRTDPVSALPISPTIRFRDDISSGRGHRGFNH